MEKKDSWYKKRMDDIPKPKTVGTVDLSREEQEEAEKTLRKLMEEYRPTKEK